LIAATQKRSEIEDHDGPGNQVYCNSMLLQKQQLGNYLIRAI